MPIQVNFALHGVMLCSGTVIDTYLLVCVCGVHYLVGPNKISLSTTTTSSEAIRRQLLTKHYKTCSIVAIDLLTAMARVHSCIDNRAHNLAAD